MNSREIGAPKGDSTTVLVEEVPHSIVRDRVARIRERTRFGLGEGEDRRKSGRME